MKKAMLIAVLVLAIAVTYSYAQMAHDMKSEGAEEMKHSDMVCREGMLGHGKIMDCMSDMMQDMSGMMKKMSGMMKKMPDAEKDKTMDRMHKMSGMMKDMCAEMNKMSEMMDSGMAKEEDMKMMHERMMEMKKRMSGKQESKEETPAKPEQHKH
ncbi:MAG: hypothetical protein HZA10_06880 [Nitrospirae bacterium]|nr:hypothetical protein [Nitrospirota bacterium]